MFKILFVLAIGFTAGYTYGFKDAKEHEQSVVTRIVERAGGSARGKYNQDVDATMQRLENR